ncbi:type I restriction enzyme HsdR N-terminal domain-containing protein [Pseudonocardia kongjuensis]|uniref:Type I restriction enzyme HsdR N-terminal domain-containing protein n=1 Tax=Pseudonocardia kongjuensis TaxID=102227 RepID=A0ABN1XJZ9_9PSEU
MSINDRVYELATKVRQQKAAIETEEATKNAFVMPFIGTVLGYDVFNPSEVIPEFTADVGVKKGEKIDYALVHGGQVQILVEAKKVGQPLRLEHSSQLFRYFAVTNARVAVLTNGEVYEFYTDLDAPNKMDAKPFLVLDLAAVDVTLLPELAKLTRESFDLDSVINAAGELKYIGQIKRALATEFRTPSTDWIKFFASRVYEKNVTSKVREQFETLVPKAATQFLNEQVNARLKTALGDDAAASLPASAEPAPATAVDVEDAAPADETEETRSTRLVVTTDEEIEGFQIVRAIVCSEVAVERVAARDTQTYFGVLLDDNNRRPIARLWFNRAQKYLGVFDENKSETRLPIDSPQDIYHHADALRKTVAFYLS